MSVRNLDKLFGPQSVALIGVGRNLRRGGLTGELMLVNPHHDTIDEMSVYPNVASLPLTLWRRPVTPLS